MRKTISEVGNEILKNQTDGFLTTKYIKWYIYDYFFTQPPIFEIMEEVFVLMRETLSETGC